MDELERNEMKAYGINQRMAGDDDVGGCSAHGRATRISSTRRQLHSLRKGKKNAIRRIFKRMARALGKKMCQEGKEMK